MDKETRIPVGDNYKEDFMRYTKKTVTGKYTEETISKI